MLSIIAVALVSLATYDLQVFLAALQQTLPPVFTWMKVLAFILDTVIRTLV